LNTSFQWTGYAGKKYEPTLIWQVNGGQSTNDVKLIQEIK